MNILIILILYDELDEKGESINLNRLLQAKKITFDELQKYIIDNKIGKIIKKENSRIMIRFEERKEIDKNCDENIRKKESKKNTKRNIIEKEIENPSDFFC